MARPLVLLNQTRMRVLRFYVKHHRMHGFSPSEREAAKALKCSCSTIRHHVALLVEAGMLTHHARFARAVLPTRRGERLSERQAS
jgi:DNA-binding transcriptional regulator YhcF (GntR family)